MGRRLGDMKVACLCLEEAKGLSKQWGWLHERDLRQVICDASMRDRLVCLALESAWVDVWAYGEIGLQFCRLGSSVVGFWLNGF
ncbi:hypothetical protein CRYUN_Cryun25bG0088700 [Craigia yunnanensis]